MHFCVAHISISARPAVAPVPLFWMIPTSVYGSKVCGVESVVVALLRADAVKNYPVFVHISVGLVRKGIRYRSSD